MDMKVTELTNKITGLKDEADSLSISLRDDLRNLDKEIVDIQHYIELGTFNASQGYKACKMLQETLKKRRDVKDGITALNYILTSKSEVLSSKEEIDSIFDSIDSGKCYTPRVRNDLFKETNVIKPEIKINFSSTKPTKTKSKPATSVVTSSSDRPKSICEAYKDGKLVHSCNGLRAMSAWIVANSTSATTGSVDTIRRHLQRIKHGDLNNSGYCGYIFKYK